MTEFLDDKNAAITDGIHKKGWSSYEQYLSAEDCAILINRLDMLEEEQRLEAAGIGRKDEYQINKDVRRDKIHWLYRDKCEADTFYLTEMENLRRDINRGLFLGLFEYEAHYALYPPGGFYKKHYDSLKGSKNRLVSTVLYLNPEWQEGDGGELAIYVEENIGSAAPEKIIQPKLGTLVAFLSEDIPHEVLPAHKERKSIAGWFRCNSSSADRVDPLR